MEIGSEFWAVPQREKQNSLLGGNVLSGRTGLELIAADVKAQGVQTVCLPAYCCSSMIVPFQKQGLQVCFYAVEPTADGVHREPPVGDAVLLMDYFGFTQEETATLAKRLKEQGTKVILDQVQSAFSKTEAEEYADYSVISWRKWFFSNAATVEKKTDKWFVSFPTEQKEDYIALRRGAAKKKQDYIENRQGEKAAFLGLYGQAEDLLDETAFYAAEEKSISELMQVDVDALIEARRKNAQFLLEELRTLPTDLVRPLFSQWKETDVPLFVPILVKPELRQPLRQYLIQNEIYCPIHWPTNLDGAKKLYEEELSLVCDQRYTREDMKREITTIKDFLVENGYLL